MAEPSYESVFDVMDGLEWPTGALAQPESIVKVENEHEFICAHQAPIQVESGLDEEVEEREQVPDTGQHIDLACALKDFQELEQLRYGVIPHRKCPEIILEDYYTSEEESMADEESSDNMGMEELYLDEFSELAPQMQL